MDQECQPVDLYLSCRNLKDEDIIGKSDPYVRVEIDSVNTGAFMRAGETEIKYDNLSPDFDKPVTIPYFFQRRQYIRFIVFDKDKGSDGNDDFLGEALT